MILLPLLAASTLAGEIRLTDCPPAVRSAIEKNSRGGVIDEIESYTVEDRRLFIADIELAGDRDLKLHVSADGVLLKTTEEITMTEMPAAVKSTAETRAAGEQIDDVKMITEKKIVIYLVEIDRKAAADIKLEISVDGKILRETEDLD